MCLSVPPFHHSCAKDLTPHGAVVKNLPANEGDTRDTSSIPGSGRLPWRKKWQPTSTMDRGAWRALVHGPQKVGCN